jgi:hypothetical protein
MPPNLPSREHTFEERGRPRGFCRPEQACALSINTGGALCKGSMPEQRYRSFAAYICARVIPMSMGIQSAPFSRSRILSWMLQPNMLSRLNLSLRAQE